MFCCPSDIGREAKLSIIGEDSLSISWRQRGIRTGINAFTRARRVGAWILDDGLTAEQS